MQLRPCQLRFRSRRPRRLTALVALVAYLLAATGMPLPIAVARHDSRPFPCQHHSCGCSSAEQCWKQCCCYTPRQKLAWAHRHGVEPPTALVAEVAALDKHDHHDHDGHDDSLHCVPPCCAHRHVEQICNHAADHDHQRPCCRQHDGETTEAVIGIMALRCRGLSTQWCTCGAVLPVVPSINWQFCWNTTDWLTLADCSAPLGHLVPLLRPPCA
jgi:hypothetical protein